MKKIQTLDKLRVALSGLLVAAKSLRREGVIKEESYKVPDSEPCVVVLGDELLVCWRRLKPEKTTEVFRMKKVDREEGPTNKRSTFYLVKLASFLERRNLYIHREKISDETNEMEFGESVS